MLLLNFIGGFWRLLMLLVQLALVINQFNPVELAVDFVSV